MRSFFAELKKRCVYRVALGYAVAAWLVVQIAATVLPAYRAPEWILPAVITLVGIGFPIALVLAWAFDVTPQGIRASSEAGVRGNHRGAWLVAAFGLVVGGLTVGGYWVWQSRSAPSERAVASVTTVPAQPGAVALPEKSIAVLPFENLSDDRENAYFTNGVQDEILTTLAKVADLKVISRTSVMQFREPAKRNLSEIAQALKVAHVLEGSVQRSANRVRVTAQLIDARTDTHLWAERYDRDLADVFAIQSEIAQKIAAQLQAVLSPREQAVMQSKPTDNMVAYDLYLRGKEIIRNNTANSREIWTEGLKFFDEAVAQDPHFLAALYSAAQAHLALYWFNFDHTDARRQLARKRIENAAAIQPDAPEVHAARALFHYWGYRDYAPAIAELEAARRALPNDAEILLFLGAVGRRQGRWADATRHYEEALTIDPRNLRIVASLSEVYRSLRRYPEAAHVLDTALTWRLNDFSLALRRAYLDLVSRGELRRLRELCAGALANATGAEQVAQARVRLALLERDYKRVHELLPATPAVFASAGYIMPRSFFEGRVARRLGEKEVAQAALLSARETTAAAVTERPDDAKALMALAHVDAELGRKEIAIAEAERSRQLLPPEKDALDGPAGEVELAMIYAQFGENNRALDLLEQNVQRPGTLEYGDLKLDDAWDPLRNDPRFEDIVASLAPKDVPPSPAK